MDKAELFRILQDQIEEIETKGKLSEWESRFISSIKDQLEKKGSLSPKQIEILERIYAEL